jgi:hypothetical protein
MIRLVINDCVYLIKFDELKKKLIPPYGCCTCSS